MQENKKNSGWVSWAVPHSEFNLNKCPYMEDDLWWKTTFVENTLRWKMTFSGRWLLVEGDRQWKTTFGGNTLQWKTTFGGRRPSVEDTLQWKMTFGGDSYPCGQSTSVPALELLLAVSTRNKICNFRKMYAALCIHPYAEKKIYLGNSQDKWLYLLL